MSSASQAPFGDCGTHDCIATPLGEAGGVQLHALHLDYGWCVDCAGEGIMGLRITDDDRKAGGRCYELAGLRFALVALSDGRKFWPLIEFTEQAGSSMQYEMGRVVQASIAGKHEVVLTTQRDLVSLGEGDEESTCTSTFTRRVIGISELGPYQRQFDQDKAVQEAVGALPPAPSVDFVLKPLEPTASPACDHPSDDCPSVCLWTDSVK